MRKCRECGGAEMRSEKREHRYIESGLENVWIEGLTFHVCPAGHELMSIPALAKLHRAIALALVSADRRFSGDEVRYMRKYLGLSNQDFARIMGVSEGQASRWATGAVDIGGSAENLLRVLVRRGVKPDGYPVDDVEYLKGLAPVADPAIRLRRSSTDWRPAA